MSHSYGEKVILNRVNNHVTWCMIIIDNESMEMLPHDLAMLNF